ncbi:hypothetical protein UABAM_03450 [Candidatus Uabimicrobium amorphum]|uniref:Glycosyltransferase n=2 Tax=Uabimicrobium amorphum TaxID=2596890 RepID=A0A5S9F3U1_UABAM|nr:hypothetical protein UABAM_03450 [Candidatus Uabimicrobium amorphum]
MRMPKLNLRDLRRIYQKLFSSPQKANTTQEHPYLKVKRVFMIPIFNWFFRKINAILFAMQVHVDKEHTVVTTLPIVADFLQNVKCRKKVYYCVDEFSEWPGHNKQQMLTMEKKLMANVDVVITTSHTLYKAKKAQARHIEILTHGVDVEHFRDTSFIPLEMEKPIIGYFGLFDERNDMELLEFVLDKYPAWNIVFIGPVVINIQALQRYKNVHFLGKIDYAILPRYVRNFDVCILPYYVNELTKYINPLKFKEYLSTEIPVVTTALPSLQDYQSVIGWSQNYEEFANRVDFYLHKETPQQKKQRLSETRQFLVGESWSEKSMEFRQYIGTMNA